MKPEAFLPSNSPWPGSAASVPATPVATGAVGGVRHPAPKPVFDPNAVIEWIDNYLRDNRNAPRKQRLELINKRYQIKLQIEAANPIDEKELRLIAERLGRKAQSGFSPSSPLPTLVVSEPAPAEVVRLNRRGAKPKPKK
ncbi:hypothetical protein [Hymenobacter weizhouensis]|uniref:hypothetical protein n=1 Tax=Hymenobacter sp. YIM 151500-1 TaxID=2987689 RepID=UPI002227A687|nr:hypothetical protein [Hymenobacter sp. YIM 151500-1]UYZ63949.1 hypothetical protein OIS53_03680 [Hymenobacter sp. YIM 151500-1]